MIAPKMYEAWSEASHHMAEPGQRVDEPLEEPARDVVVVVGDR